MIQAEINNIEEKVLETLYTLDDSYEKEDYLHANYSDSGMLDSIAFVSLVVELEDVFGISIDDEYLKLENLSTFQSIVEMVNNLIKEQS